MIKKNNWKAWLYLAPVIILMAIFTVYPLISTIGIAFLKNYNYLTQSSDGFTWDNFGVVLGLIGFGEDAAGNRITYYGPGIAGASYMTDVIRYAIPNTLIIVFVTVPVSTIIALLIAVALNSIPWLKKSLQTIFFIPYVTNAIAVGMVFAVLFDYQGIINYIFNDMGHAWIDLGASQARAMVALCIYIIWQALPFKILIFLSGLAGIDKQYYDAAKIDSASRWSTLMHITVPLLSPQILYVLITSFIGAFKEYTAVVGLIGRQGTSAGSKNMYTIVYYIYDTIGQNNVQYGAAAAVLLFIVILIFTAVQFWVSNKRVYY
jgi:multiple sugar transport system permease protein